MEDIYRLDSWTYPLPQNQAQLIGAAEKTAYGVPARRDVMRSVQPMINLPKFTRAVRKNIKALMRERASHPQLTAVDEQVQARFRPRVERLIRPDDIQGRNNRRVNQELAGHSSDNEDKASTDGEISSDGSASV